MSEPTRSKQSVVPASIETALDASTAPIKRLTALMTVLRDREHGCPWDVEQTFATIAPYTIEEAYEVADAIERDDMSALRDELGDLLFQVIFHSQMAQESGAFSFDDVALAIVDKMVRRHPHVFEAPDGRDAEAQTHAWEAIKAAERAAKGENEAQSLLDDLPLALPALVRAEKLQKRAARAGFDWPTAERVFDKLDEEITELKQAIVEGDQAHITEELGDLLFVVANLGRKLGAQSEDSLRAANAKFERRFKYIEARLAAVGRSADEADLDEMEALWSEAKLAERGG
ncbi:MAG: nucleoside triphosphate pyrophosphohydrolase [Pseudomonadota bacterium]